VQRGVPVGHPVQRLHPRGAGEGPRPHDRGRRREGMMETEYGPGRTIPHPVMFRVLDSEAEDTTIPELRVEHKSEFAYYPGCIDYYDVEMQFSHMNYGDTNHGIIFDSSIKLLRAVGIQPMILDRSFMKCCGHDQLWQGKVDVFERMRDYNTKIIKMLGVKTFITSCAEGYRTFKLDYKLDGVRVVHITQFLYERGLRIPPQPETAKKIRVAFQDPCRSGRQMPLDPVYEEPRELVKRVDNAELVELKTFRADAQCCGVAQMMYCNDKTKGLTASRMDEASDVGPAEPSGGSARGVLSKRPPDEPRAGEGTVQARVQGPHAGVHPRPRHARNRGRRDLHGVHPLLRQLRLRSDRHGGPEVRAAGVYVHVAQGDHYRGQLRRLREVRDRVSCGRDHDGHEAWVRGEGRTGRLDDRPATGSEACRTRSRHPETRDAAPRGETCTEPTDSRGARGAFETDRDALPQGPSAETGTGGGRGRGVHRGVH